MKEQSYALANALAATTAIVFVACRVLVGLFPDASFGIAQSWFHGIAFSKLAPESLTMPSFILGLISATITAWLIGYLFARTYKFFLK